MIYGPEEDTYFLRDFVEGLELEGKKFLEMGAGKGVAAQKALEKGAEVTAVDINPEAVEYMEENLPEAIEVIKSDLFNVLEGKFDLIVFNPPYLSGQREGERDPLIGGDEGTELISRFLESINDYLTENGAGYVVVSSENSFEDLINDFNMKKVNTERKLWFETLYLLKTG